MITHTDVSYTDLQTRGFVVIPGFLSPADLQSFIDDFEAQPFADNSNYRLKNASTEANRRVVARINPVLVDVMRQTDLKVDGPQGASYFSTRKDAGVNFAWHQDHESFFELQNHYDYLNFYLPIIKPRPDKSNLSVVPFDVLEKASPSAFKTLVRGGATRFVWFRGRQMAVCDDSGSYHTLDVPLDSVAYTPQLNAGDLLLMRGDIVHRTQDTETERVAMSFRVTSTKSKVTRAKLARGGLGKAQMMANNAAHYERMFRAFQNTGSNELTVIEMREAMARVQETTLGRRRDFLLFLMKEKLRTGTMPHFVASVTSAYALHAAAVASRLFARAKGAGA